MTTTSSGASSARLVVLAAGLGTRYGSLKQLDPVGPGGTALLDFALADARRAGLRGGVLVVREEIRRVVEDHLARTVGSRFDVQLVSQRLDDLPGRRPVPAGRSKPWGTAHAVWAARHALTGPFVVANADDYYGKGAYRALHSHLSGAGAFGAWALAGYRLDDVLSVHGPVNRGICRVDDDGWLEDIVEVREIQRARRGLIEGRTREEGLLRLDGSETASTNLWAFTAGAMAFFEAGLNRFLDERGGDRDAECLLPDVIRVGLGDEKCRVRVYPVEDEYFGVTRSEDRPEVAERLARLGHPWEGD